VSSASGKDSQRSRSQRSLHRLKIAFSVWGIGHQKHSKDNIIDVEKEVNMDESLSQPKLEVATPRNEETLALPYRIFI
jgi:hypothetical protein